VPSYFRLSRADGRKAIRSDGRAHLDAARDQRDAVTGVCVCTVSPLGHRLTPGFPQVRSPRCFALRASEALVIAA
jgi:hypothetical protein